MQLIKMPLSHYLEYVGLVVLGRFIRSLTRGTCWWLSGILGVIAFDFLRIRRKVTLENLRDALGKDRGDNAGLKKTARLAYQHIGFTFMEMMRYPLMAGRILSFYEPESIEQLKEVVPNEQGGIFISAHFGSWEMLGAMLYETGYPTAALAKPQSNKLVDKLVARYRRMLGIRVFAVGQSAREMVRSLRQGEFVGIISDQDAGSQGVFVDFFGRKASTPAGTAQLALKYHIPLYVLLGLRVSPERYRIIIEKVPIAEGWGIEEITQAYTRIIEEVIRGNPEQYFWMHRRWKTGETLSGVSRH